MASNDYSKIVFEAVFDDEDLDPSSSSESELGLGSQSGEEPEESQDFSFNVMEMPLSLAEQSHPTDSPIVNVVVLPKEEVQSHDTWYLPPEVSKKLLNTEVESTANKDIEESYCSITPGQGGRCCTVAAGGQETAAAAAEDMSPMEQLIIVMENEEAVAAFTATAGVSEDRRIRGQARRRGESGDVFNGECEDEQRKGNKIEEVYLKDDDLPMDVSEKIAKEVSDRDEKRRKYARQANQNEDDEVKFDVEDFRHFDWSPMETFRGVREVFLPTHTGAKVNVRNPYEAFRTYWEESILAVIAEETNRHAATIVAASDKFRNTWYDTSVHEILILFCFWMLLGIHKMPTLQSCFSVHPLLKTDVFRCLFSKNRMVNLLRALHFLDNESANTNRLYSLQPILDHLNRTFQDSYTPSQNICIDESLTLWKGNLAFKQYMKRKAARFGLKTFELCESKTGYLWSFFVYTEKQSSPVSSQSSLKSSDTVLRLIKPLLNQGYVLHMDNWFNSLMLARYLKQNKTDCIGILRPNRKDVPPLVKVAPLKEGTFVARHSGDVTVLAWQDKKRVTAISTCHGSTVEKLPAKRNTPALYIPRLILDYNAGKGGVDRNDQMLEPYLHERKRCLEWNMKLFKRLLNVSILNSRILLESSSGKEAPHLAYLLELINSIIARHQEFVNKPRPTVVHMHTSDLHPYRLISTLGHWPEQTPFIEGTTRHKRLRCTWCAKRLHRQTRSIFVCSSCEIPLCVQGCFRDFHTKP